MLLIELELWMGEVVLMFVFNEVLSRKLLQFSPRSLYSAFYWQVWELSDIDRDGMLDRDEFAVVSIFCLLGF